MNKTKQLSLAITLLIASGLTSTIAANAADNIVADNSGTKVPMVSGGIGSDEEDRLRDIQKQYNLKLLFTENNGEYLANVSVHVQDKQGNTVVDTVAGGPILMMTLPPGSYKVQATEGSEVREQKVSVSEIGKNLKAYQFRFRAAEQDSDNNG